MKITFLGAAGGVTGSKTLLKVGKDYKEQYLVDYGLYQGAKENRERNWMSYHGASKLSAVFLTHAHIDHSGLLPRLYRDGFRGRIYCTKETFRLCQILLMDSARIHEEDAKYANRKKISRHKPALPLYTTEEAQAVLKHFEVVDFEEELTISKNIAITFFWAGHILGASFIRIRYKTNEGEEKTIVFSGDIGHKRNILLDEPQDICETDYLVLESTYGNKLHARIPAKEVLGMYLNTILKRGGVAVIPAFSVGRTQDILYLIKELMNDEAIPSVPVHLDSPLSKKANRIFNDCFHKGHVKEHVTEDIDIYPDTFVEIEDVEDSKALTQMSGPRIVVSASGMIDGGRVVYHVMKHIVDENSGIILVGFQPEGTKGRILINGEKELHMHKQKLPVRASIFYIDSLSAHGDYLDFIGWINESRISPKLVILNHGEEQASSHLKILLESQLNLRTTVATFGEEFDLENIYDNQTKVTRKTAA
ncbi:MBL fold metallo-hydrolase [Halobacteriovorax sp. RZ-1]|uniref:MBL fold metallo-hydrolase RNA specificity domain-containing protein n=1 Tax=unclassified Halobacteriovorax TaxID=2639665 RepID=UPI00371C3A1C